QGNLLQQADTSADGSYVIKGLLAGRYGIQFFPGCEKSSPYEPQWWPGTANERKQGLIRLRAGAHRKNIDAKLVVGATIKGTVRLGSPHGRPLGGMCASASVGLFDLAGMSSTDSHGGYVLEGLPAGRYSVEFNPGCGNNGNYLSASYPHPVTVHDGQVIGHIDGVLQLGAEISGTVTDLSSGAPLRGICVSIGNGLAMVSTGKHGTFFAKQIPPGRYTVEFANCSNKGNFAPQFYPGQLNPAAAGEVTLAAGKATTHIDAAMTTGGTITGTLRSASGVKLSNVCGAAILAADLQAVGPNGLNFLAQISPSTAGLYTIRNLAAGRYQVAFGTCGGPNFADQYFEGQADSTKADQISLADGQTITGVNATLQPAGVITGIVKGPSHQKGQFDIVCVDAVNSRTGVQSIEQPMANVGGRYAIGGLATGSYFVDFEPCFGENLIPTSAGRPVRVTARHITTGVTAALHVGGVIKGRVVSAATGQPVSGVCVDAFDTATQSFGFSFGNRQGNYVINGLSSGRYQLIFSSCDGTHLLPLHKAGVTAIAGRTLPGPTARMRTFVPGSISGRVTSAVPVRGTPGVCVDVFPVRGGNPGEGPAFGGAGVHGYYEIRGLVPGRYQVFFGDALCEPYPGNLIPQWYNARPTQASATVITVKSGQVTRPISARLRPAGGITGTVTGPGGKPVTGICVRAISQGRGGERILAITGSGGGYRLGSLQPGRYLLEFFTSCGASRYITQWWKNASSPGTATPLLIKSGQVKSGIDATLARQK
ncbi:MAG TPA: carboxypeptidase-like regulatory domain-containing protein, partial [Streptosporangiaceae bacterium]|nr:carboxypeptidase-like regulatory domain-containing protein [Streptosporangiaceae bacterium]